MKQNATTRTIAHNILNTAKSKFNVWSIMMKVDDQDYSKSPFPEPNVQLSLHQALQVKNNKFNNHYDFLFSLFVLSFDFLLNYPSFFFNRLFYPRKSNSTLLLAPIKMILSQNQSRIFNPSPILGFLPRSHHLGKLQRVNAVSQIYVLGGRLVIFFLFVSWCISSQVISGITQCLLYLRNKVSFGV